MNQFKVGFIEIVGSSKLWRHQDETQSHQLMINWKVPVDWKETIQAVIQRDRFNLILFCVILFQ